jgi:hypothetical protein
MTILIIGLFLLNIQMEKDIHAWREGAHSNRAQKRPKTLLQKIVELAPTYVQAAPTGPALPTGQTVEERGPSAHPSGNEQVGYPSGGFQTPVPPGAGVFSIRSA